MTLKMSAQSFWILPCMLGLSALAACRPRELEAHAAPAVEAAPVSVRTGPATLLEVPKTLRLTGTLRGDREVDLAANASGRVLRVKGRGVTTSKGTGDLLATVVVAVPSNLPSDAKKKLEEFAAAMPAENPRADLLDSARG